jgi:hypothetical protein
MANLLSWLGDRVHDAENGIGQAVGGVGQAIGQGVQNVEHTFAPPAPVQQQAPQAAPSFGFGQLPPLNAPAPTTMPNINDLTNTINQTAQIGPKYQQPIQKPDFRYGGSSQDPSNNPISRVADPLLQGVLGRVPLLNTPVNVANQANDFANKYSTPTGNPVQSSLQGAKDIVQAGVDNSPQVQALKAGGQLFGNVANQATQSLGLNNGQTNLPFFGQTQSASNLVADKGLGGAALDTLGNVISAGGFKTGVEAPNKVEAPSVSPQVQALADSAKANDPAFQAKIAQLASDQGLGYKPGPPKTANRIDEKTANENGGDFSKIYDATRATVSVPDPRQMAGHIAAIQEQYPLARPVKDGMNNEGYQDVKVNVKLPDGSNGEVLLATPEMLEAKHELGGHALYEEARTTEDATKLATLEAQMKDLYQTAQAKTQARLAAEDTSRPSTNALAGEKGLPVDTTVPTTALPSDTNLTSVSPTSKNLVPGDVNGIVPPSLPTIAQKAGDVNTVSTPPLERGFSKTVRNSPNTSPELAATAPTTYEAPRSTAELQKSAQDMIKNDFAGAREHALTGIDDHSIATAAELIKHYDKLGDTASANEIEQKASANLTEHGRAIQAATLYNKLAPDSIIRHTNNLLTAAGKKPIDEATSNALIEKSKAVQAMPEGAEKTFALNDLKREVAKQIPPSLGDKAVSLWRTGLLTGPQTVTKVMVSHAVENAAELTTKIPASLLDKFLVGPLSGQRSQTLSLTGYGSGLLRGAKAAGAVLKSGEERPFTSGMGGAIGEVSAHNANYGSGFMGHILNAYSNKVGDIHAAMPKIFYAAAHDNALHDYAGALGRNQGLKGAELQKFVTDSVANPTKEMLDVAKHDAEMATFQQKTKIGDAASGIQGKTGIFGKVAAPFTRIPSAIATDVVNYSPVGVPKTIIEALKDKGAEGWTPAVQRRFVQGLGRSITGSAVPTIGAALYASGNLALGYPTDPKTRDLWAAEGKQANSIKIGGRWRQLSSLGPLGSLLTMGGYFAEAGTTNAKGVSQLSAGVFGGVKSLADQTYLQGISSLAGAVNDPARSFNTYIKNQAASVIPTGLGTVARAIDPLQRQTNSIGDAIAAKVPGLRQGLTPKLDAFGNPLQRAGSVAENLLDPTRPSGANPGTNPALMSELDRLATTGNTVFPDQAKDKTIGTSKDAVKLDPTQTNDRRAAEGPQVQQAYQAVINDPKYAALSDANKAKALSNAATDVNSVQAVKTLVATGNDTQAQKAYNALTPNQKAMMNGQLTVKDYTNLDTNGKALNTAKVDPATAYQQKLDKFNQQKAAGLLSATDIYKQQQALGKEAITSKYNQDVQNLYNMSKNDRKAATTANPQLATLLPQVNQLSSDLSQNHYTSTDKVAKENSAPSGGGSGKLGGGKVRPPQAHKMTVAHAGSAFTKLVGRKIAVPKVHIAKVKAPKRLA